MRGSATSADGALSLLDVPHVERRCDECGKSVFLVEPGEGGQGIQVRKGDRFTIPAGWITMSLDPAKARGQFARPGISWFVAQLLAGELPSTEAELRPYLERLKNRADEILEGSEKVSHLDHDDEQDAAAAVAILEQDKLSVEWWAFVMGATATALLEREDGDPSERLVWAVRMQSAHSMLVFKEQLEQHVWTGYRHTKIIYDVAASGARTPEDAEKIRALRPMFSKLDEDVLHAWVESGLPLAPRIGVQHVDEELLRALATYHLSLFERRRQESRADREHSTKVWTNRIAAAVAGAALATVVIKGLEAAF